MATVSTGQEISAAQYNGLQSRVLNILGTGSYSSSDISANSGYGQSLASAQVSPGTVVLASHMDALRTDINKCSNHQIGADANIGNIEVGQVIAANTSSGDTNEGYNDYDSAITVITSNKFLIDPGNATSGNFLSSVRTISWNGTIKHIVAVTFSSFAQRRYFFNAGGQIRFAASLTDLTDSSGSKGTDWANMLSNMGIISFNYNNTSSSGSGIAQPIGNYNLSTTPQTIFTKSGGSVVYAENQYVITAKHNNATGTVLTFDIQFQDNDLGDRTAIGPAVDEYVIGTLTSYIQYFQPTGSNVSVSLPSVATTTSL